MSPPPVIGICTDSSANTAPAIVERFGVEVVPMTVAIDGHEQLEGDLDIDEFYARFAGGGRPTVVSSEPSPGQFAAAYDDLVARGCSAILSVHLSSSISATVNQARLAARSVQVPIRVVDTGIGGVGVGSCVWLAAEALACGASLDTAAALVERTASQVGTVFVVTAPELTAAGGDGVPGDGVPVLTLRDGAVHLVERVRTFDHAVRCMASYAAGWGTNVRVGVGLADRAGTEMADALAAALTSDPNVADLVRYRVAPSVGARTGAGTVGCFMVPSP